MPMKMNSADFIFDGKLGTITNPLELSFFLYDFQFPEHWRRSLNLAYWTHVTTIFTPFTGIILEV